MKILSMDTAAASCSVAIWQDSAISHHHLQEMTRGHASDLLPMIEAVLKEANMAVADFDALAVTVGPGAFTGLRIGLAAARGFAVAAKLPVIGVTTLEALAFGAGQGDGPLLCALDAKRADLYMQLYDKDGVALSEAQALLPEAALDLVGGTCKELRIAGDSFDRLEGLFLEDGIKVSKCDVIYPDARYVAEVAAKRGIPAEDQARPSAFYIRPPDAALPKNGGRLRP